MTIQEFKKTARLLKELYKELEDGAIRDGVSIYSDEYKEAQSRLREETLARLGFTLDEYREAKERVAPAKKTDTDKQALEASTIASETKNSLDALIALNEEKILSKADERARKIAEAIVKPPVIENRIVERTTVEKPKIVKETITQIVKEEYDDAPLRAEMGYLNDKLDNLEIPEPFDAKSFLDEIRSEFSEKFKVNIDTLGMPDFRKLGMGLRQDLDTKVEGVNVTRLIASATQPTDPRVGDIWLQI